MLWLFALLAGFFRLSLGIVPVGIPPEANVKRIPVSHLDLKKPYMSSYIDYKYWEFGGSTIIDSDSAIQLTADMRHKEGYVTSLYPLDCDNFEIEFEVCLWSSRRGAHGDGLAIWIVDKKLSKGKLFGANEKFRGLGIFFDTFKNGRDDVNFPYVSAMLSDGEKQYDYNDNRSSEVSLGISVPDLRSKNTREFKLTYWKDFGLELKRFNVKTKKWDNYLMMPKLKLPDVKYIGLSARTGLLSDVHELKRMQSFILIANEDKILMFQDPKRILKNNSMIFKSGLLCVCLLTVYGFSVTYRLKRRKKI